MDYLEKIPDAEIIEISPRFFHYYLRSLGFKKSFESEESMIFHHPNNSNIEVEIPKKNDSHIYLKEIGNALKEVSRFEGRNPRDVIQDIPNKSPSDTIVFRNINEETVDGSIPLTDAIETLNSARIMLTSVAHTVTDVNPRTYYKILNRKDARDFIRTCKMGQTERGSFITNIKCPFAIPIPLNQTNLDQFDEEISTTLTRRITSAFIESASILYNCIENEDNYDLNIITKEKSKGLPVVISGNFCEALAELKPWSQEGQVDISMKWGGTPPTKRNVPSKVTFFEDQFDEVEKIADNLKPKENYEEMKLIGRIREVYEDRGASSPDQANTEFLAFVALPDGNTVRARVTLNGSDRDLAYEASKNFKDTLLSGRLTKKGKQYYIEKPKIIELKEEE